MKLTIGILEDDLVSQFATRYCIEQSGHECEIIIYDDARMALENFSSNNPRERIMPDILFVDLIMPMMGGWEFLDRLEKIKGQANDMEIYVLSAFTNSKDRISARQHAMIKGFFDKPLSRYSIDKILDSRKS